MSLYDISFTLIFLMKLIANGANDFGRKSVHLKLGDWARRVTF